MILTQDNINSFLNKYITFVNKISDYYNYDNNIRHLLYLIVPGFVAKYGISNEKSILVCFEKVRIYISGTEDNTVTATFNRILRRNGNNYYTEKYVVLNQYKKASFTNMFDNIIHEFNHAVNSLNNEISLDDKYIKLRTGLCYLVYDRKNMKFLYKSNESFLEEVINTEQTEEIINIINSFGNYTIENVEFNNTLHVLKNEIVGNNYISDSYAFQSLVCDILMKNKTFYPTISNLRFKGFVDDIPIMFDGIIGKNGSYQYLNVLLKKIYNLQIKYSKSLFFKKIILNKIKLKAQELLSIIKEYDNKCIYK